VWQRSRFHGDYDDANELIHCSPKAGISRVFREDSGVSQPDILAKWAANAPLAFVDQYIGNLKQYRGISMDVGDQDGLRVDAAPNYTMSSINTEL
jgi:hypothetical protein